MRVVTISLESAPALGDIRLMKSGELIRVTRDAVERPDWTRYMDAIRQAMGNGVNVEWPPPRVVPDEGLSFGEGLSSGEGAPL